MNRERAKELLPIIQAFADGKYIECREAGYDQKWMGDGSQNPDFAWHDHLEYRIKPEPREFWIILAHGKDPVVRWEKPTPRISSGLADDPIQHGFEIIHTSEVLDDE